MLKTLRMRTLALCLVIIILVSALPIAPAVALDDGEYTFDVPGIQLTGYTGDYVPTVTDDDAFCLSASGLLNSLVYESASASVTLQIAADDYQTRVLTFDYYPVMSAPAEQAGSVSFQRNQSTPESVTTPGAFSQYIEAGESFSLKVSVATFAGPNTTSVEIENVRLEESVSTTVFIRPDDKDNGVYNHGSILSRLDSSESFSSRNSYSSIITGYDSIEMQATPSGDYDFLAFIDYDTRVVLSHEDCFTYSPVSSNQRITALFVPASLDADDDDANFVVGTADDPDANYYCSSLEDAIDYAKYAADRVITVNQESYELEAAEDDYYVIPRGVTLLVPFDSEHTMFTTVSGATYDAPATVSASSYCLLTLGEGAFIEVERGGAISVSAVHPAASQSYPERNGAVTGQYGQIDMSEDSGIILDDGASLYAWGFITGEGTIEAMEGSSVYEYFQVYDYRGGNSLANMMSGNQFFFNQYYVQNIEARTYFCYGSTEYVLMALTHDTSQVLTVIRPFIGEGGAFHLDSYDAVITKYYDPADDIMNYDFVGKASFHSISIEVMGNTVSTDNFYLPINNIVVNLQQGAVVNMDKKVIFMPGSTANVAAGAEIQISETGSVVFADPTDPTIQNYSYHPGSGGGVGVPFTPASFSPSRTGTRTYDDTASGAAALVNNGTVIVEGSLTSTSGSDNISGNGAFVFESTASAPTLTYFVSGTPTTPEDHETEPITLTNDVAAAPVDTDVRWTTPASFTKINGEWGDYRYVSVYPEFVEGEAESPAPIKESDRLMTFDEFEIFLNDVTPPEKPMDVGHTYAFKEWAVITDGDYATTLDHINYSATYTSTAREYPIHWLDENGAWLKDTVCEYDKRPTDAPSLTKTSTDQYSYNLKWLDTATGQFYARNSLPKAYGEMTFQAYFEPVLRSYTVTLLQYYNNTSLQSITYSYGDSVNLAEDMTKTPDKPSGTGVKSTPYGWRDKETGVVYKVGDSFTDLQDELPPVVKDTVYEAVYSVTLQWYDGITTATYKETSALTGDTFLPPDEYLTFDDYNGNKFVGWKKGSTTTTVWDSYSIPALDKKISAASSIKFTAVYENNIKGKTLVLDGEIGETIKFEDALSLVGASMTYTVPESSKTEEVEYNTEQLADKKISINLAPAELTYDISVFYKHTTNKNRYFKTSGAAYADSLFASSPAADAPEDGHYYLVGTINGNNCWENNIRTCYELKENPNVRGEYMLEHVLLHEGDQFKVICYNYDGQGHDYRYGQSNANIQSTGLKTIYFRPDSNSNWSPHYYFYVSDDSDYERMDIDKAKTVTSALMNYATAAQLYFRRNVTDLANSHVNGNVYTYLDSETDEKIDALNTSSANTMTALKADGALGATLSANYGLTYYGSALTLNSGVVVRHYFLVTNEALVPESVTFTSGTRTVSADKHVYTDPQIVYYEYVAGGNGIPGAELGNTITISFTAESKPEISGNYNVFNYVKLALDNVKSLDNPSEKKLRLAAMLRAMYWYYIEAENYFNLV